MAAAPESIRPAQAEDMTALVELLIALHMFPAEEINQLTLLLSTFFGNQTSLEFWIVDDDPQLGFSGVAYCAPERMTEGTWNLYLIGIHYERRGKGRGFMLLRTVEAMAAARGGRILLVETSGEDGFEGARTFYAKSGYREEARIRDFYKDGDDKVVFWKALR